MDSRITDLQATLSAERMAFAAGVRQAKLDGDAAEQLRCLRGFEDRGRALASLAEYLHRAG